MAKVSYKNKKVKHRFKTLGILEHWTVREARKKSDKQYQRRAAAAKKGWETRHKHREEGLISVGVHPSSAKDWARLSPKKALNLVNLRDSALGESWWLHGKSKHGRIVLADKIRMGDSDWEAFLMNAMEQGYSPRQARTAFFSPPVTVGGPGT